MNDFLKTLMNIRSLRAVLREVSIHQDGVDGISSAGMG